MLIPAEMDLQDMHFVIVAITLYLFWLLLSGHFATLLLGLGALSVLLVVWILRRMDCVDGEPTTAHFSLGLIGYSAWLLWSVFKANLDVVRRIWDPSLPIDPRWRRLDTQVMSPVQKTLYANSITLTPGTLTTDVHDDYFMVHSISAAGIDELKTGEMERRIRRLGL